MHGGVIWRLWRASSPAAAFHRVLLLGVLVAGMVTTSLSAARSRVSLLEFEGDRAQQLRWRVSREIKQAGHLVPPFRAPAMGSPPERFSSYSERRRIDVMVSGASREGDDEWTLELTLHGPDGEPLGAPLTFRGATLADLVQDLKGSGRDRLRDALESPGSGGSIARSAQPAPEPRRRRARKRRAARAEPVDLDVDSDSPPEAEPASGDGGDESATQSAAASSQAPADAWDADGGDGSAGPSPRESKPRGKLAFLSSPALVSDVDEREADAAGGSNSGDPDSGDLDSGAGEDAADEPFLSFGIHAGMVRRTLSYVDDLYRRMRTPNTTAWVYHLEAAVLPFARPLRDRVALIASYESVFSGQVRDDAVSASFDLNHSELAGGIRLRQPLGQHALELDVTFGQLRSGLGDPEGLSRVPELRYTQVRSALALVLGFDQLSLRGSAGLRIPTSFGQAADAEWFPRIDGTGVEGALGFGYAVGDGVSIAVGGSVRRFVLEMNSRPEDATEGVAEVAGGAIDLYLSGYFGLNVVL